ncbi:ubiquitin-conjugating enzyme E2-binding protein [Stachybotrys elegans]|uniref:Ubiquitin-conjugating enzyme E2-binding protein n=1 Tax=Stachybotrys elegans TaxID=80388 RepID=A0A8K0T8E8_9HYPO|nr:ubiquitin-conjugating enzyme E2-binding protein [Stachybotrys elegans]
MTVPTSARSVSAYAELMPSVRQISVAATLPSPADPTTKAEVIDNGRFLRICHQNNASTLALPAVVYDAFPLATPSPGSLDLNWRLPLAPGESEVPQLALESYALPWSSSDIKVASPIQCRACDEAIVPAGRIQVWKDLPSENWAEMMEFWHCHKPHDHEHNDDESLTKRGYGASTSIACPPSTGFVDLSSMVFSESDCRNILYSATTFDAGVDSSALALDSAPSSKLLRVFCQGCRADVGLYRVAASSVSLYKWQIRCDTISSGALPTSTECLSGSLITSISRSGSAKSIVMPHVPTAQAGQGSSEQVLHLWVLNSSLKYSSSSVPGKQAAIKVFYKDVDVESAYKLMESMNSDIQEINFPSAAIASVREQLHSSTLLLPRQMRSFQGWNVGLLARWDSES